MARLWSTSNYLDPTGGGYQQHDPDRTPEGVARLESPPSASSRPGLICSGRPHVSAVRWLTQRRTVSPRSVSGFVEFGRFLVAVAAPGREGRGLTSLPLFAPANVPRYGHSRPLSTFRSYRVSRLPLQTTPTDYPYMLAVVGKRSSVQAHALCEAARAPFD